MNQLHKLRLGFLYVMGGLLLAVIIGTAVFILAFIVAGVVFYYAPVDVYVQMALFSGIPVALLVWPYTTGRVFQWVNTDD